ncbi:DUF4352 domain-containing protein [Vagococcus sp.]|uniref:DUF4352 domain-containing protein n=1 Tax=Vagococcus sp. TaxID=1933889 RepID=UPI002FC60F54
MKKLLISIGLGMVLLLSACSGSENKNETTKVETAAESKSVVIDGIRIKIKKQELDEITVDGKIKQLLTFTVSGENISSTEKGLGSVDFILKTKDGKELEVDPSMVMFGDAISPGKTLTGKVSFTLNEKQTATKLVYKPLDKELAEWEVSAQ